jgi:hypothetical protein
MVQFHEITTAGRVKMIESFFQLEVADKTLFLVTERMHESYEKRLLHHWQPGKAALDQIRVRKYGVRADPRRIWLRLQRSDTELLTLPINSIGTFRI